MDITIDCAAALEASPYPCDSEIYGYPVMFIVGQTSGSLTVAGDVPTVAEFQTGIADVLLDKLIVLEQVTNGSRVENDLEEESGADTADGLSTVFGTNIITTGKVKLLDETIRADLAKLALYPRIRVWTITSTGWVFGGAKGYKVANYISPTFLEGFGTRAAKDVRFIHKHDRNSTDPAAQDDGYLDLVNP